MMSDQERARALIEEWDGAEGPWMPTLVEIAKRHFAEVRDEERAARGKDAIRAQKARETA
jgi:hypothetical protein